MSGSPPTRSASTSRTSSATASWSAIRSAGAAAAPPCSSPSRSAPTPSSRSDTASSPPWCCRRSRRWAALTPSTRSLREWPPGGLPTLSSANVKEADSLAHERFGIEVDWLMEAAGWQLARFCQGRTVVACGIGNNAGDGLAVARHLHRWGRLASVACLDAGRLRGPAAKELEALRKLGVDVTGTLLFESAEVVLDAIFGTGISRAPEGNFATWIDAINDCEAHVISVDVPSGLDADTGVAYAPTVKARTTVTLGLPKAGLVRADGPRLAGEVWVADIGMPLEVYAELGIDVPSTLFAAADRFRLEAPAG
ncbi:MAG: NAD(P)H-hydrate epimerase [Chloroflexi bacterium]|nr:MAG: NAD(P)H-hydrate epimerase [Chloroflexota bacterium]